MLQRMGVKSNFMLSRFMLVPFCLIFEASLMAKGRGSNDS